MDWTLLITGAGGSAASNVAYSLRNKHHLVGVDINPYFLHLSPFFHEKNIVPRCKDPAYLDALNAAIEKHDAKLIWPQPDPEVLALSALRSRLKAKIWMPDDSVIRMCQDKNACLDVWSKKGFRRAPRLVENDDFSGLVFPTWLRATRGAGGRLSALCKTEKQASAWISYVRENGYEDALQSEEYLPGRDYCFLSIWKKGELLTSYASERLARIGTRSMSAGGTSSLNRIVHSEVVNRMALDAICAVDQKPDGVYNVDLKEDAAGVARPTEINAGRWVTNVIFSTLASERFEKPEWNFPELAVRLAFDESLPELKKTDALTANLYFAKNVDMGYAVFFEDELPS